MVCNCGRRIVRKCNQSRAESTFSPCRVTLSERGEEAMIRLVNLVLGLVLVGAIAAGVASAKEIKKEVTFS